jgi:hypothetical protein
MDGSYFVAFVGAQLEAQRGDAQYALNLMDVEPRPSMFGTHRETIERTCRWTLEQVELQRKLLDLHQPLWNDSPHIDNDFYGCLTCWESDLCDTAKLLAAPYADVDGYREEWKP